MLCTVGLVLIIMKVAEKTEVYGTVPIVFKFVALNPCAPHTLPHKTNKKKTSWKRGVEQKLGQGHNCFAEYTHNHIMEFLDSTAVLPMWTRTKKW